MSALQLLLERAELDVRSYSGRGMYGDTCLGVDASIRKVALALVEGVDDDNRSEVMESLGSMETDSMGRGTIVYFPGTPFVGDEESSDDEEDDS